MKRFLWVIAWVLSAAVVLTGCGGGGGGSTTTSSGGSGSGGGTTSAYAGTSRISGSITVSGSDAAAVTQASTQAAARLGGLSAAAARAATTRAGALTTDAVVKLLVVGAGGDLEDTGIDCTLVEDSNGNPTYTCDGIKDGVNYVVRYVKLLGDGRAVDMKANVEVPQGTAAVTDKPVNAKTSVVVEALVDAILDATSGSNIDDATVNSIVDAVATTIENLVDSGVIQIPSMIVEADAGTVEDVAAATTTNENLENASGNLLAEDSLATELGVAKTEITAANFDMSSVSTDAEKRAFIQLVFDEMMEGDDMPSFMIQFFGDKFVEGMTMTVSQLMDAVQAGIQLDAAATSAGVTVTKSEAITAFSAEIATVNDLLAKKAAGTITAAEKAELAEIPGIIPGLFPASDAATWVTNFNTNTSMNVPQGIAFVIYIVDVYLQEKFDQAQLGSGTATQGADGSVSYDQKDYVDFDPFAPGGLFELMGFQTWAQANAGSLGVDIFELWLHPGTMWIESTPPGNGQEVDALNAGTCFMNFADLMSQQQPDYSGATVTLTYPKADGTTGTVALAQEQWGGGGGMGDSCWMVDPWMQSGCQNWDWQTNNGPCPIDSQYVVSDFASGTYTINVTLADGTTASKSFTKKVITGMNDARAKLISPAAQPEWPGNDATQAEMDAFNTAQQNYQMSNFPANVVCDTWDSVDTAVCLVWHDPAAGETADAAVVSLAWEAPAVTLPAGVKIRYNIDVGLDQGCDQNGCNWQHVWSSWDQDRNIYATSFKLPRAVKKLTAGQGQFNVNIDVGFVDRNTGEDLGMGGHAWGQFTVQDPLDTTATFTVTGAVTVYDTSQGWPGTVMTSLPTGLNLKAGLIKEVCNWDILVGDPCTRTIVSGTTAAVNTTDGSFSITPTLGDFLDNATNGAWVDVRVWDDVDDDNQIDQDSTGTGVWENEGWYDWDVTAETHFNVWGGRIEVNTQTCTAYTTRQDCDQNGAWQWSNQVLTGGETVDFLQDFRFDYWQQPTP